MKLDQSKYDETGQLKNGRFDEHFKDGSLSCLGAYLDGEKDREWQYFLKNGRLKAQGHFDNGNGLYGTIASTTRRQ